MEDEAIVSLYWQRSESAIRETEVKYDRYLTKIAWNILADREDSRESVNDTYLALWNAIPPEKPDPLTAYVYRVGMVGGQYEISTALGLMKGVVSVVLIVSANNIIRKMGEKSLW